MPRRPRLDYPDARHHVMNRGARRKLIFFDDQCRELFLELLGDLPERFGVLVHAYALMPNHFHLLLQTPGANLGRAMALLCSEYVRRTNQRFGWDGSLFKGRYHNRVVEDVEYWQHLLAYLHLNPLRAGMLLSDN